MEYVYNYNNAKAKSIFLVYASPFPVDWFKSRS